jgi:hypothetical protein
MARRCAPQADKSAPTKGPVLAVKVHYRPGWLFRYPIEKVNAHNMGFLPQGEPQKITDQNER